MKRIELGEEFTLSFGEQAEGPDELMVFYEGFTPGEGDFQSTPGLTFAQPGTDQSRYPLWATPYRRQKGELVGRMLWGDYVTTATAIEERDPNTATLVVESKKKLVKQFELDRPFTMEPCTFVSSPDGIVIAFNEVAEGHITEVRLSYQWLNRYQVLETDHVYLRFEADEKKRRPDFIGPYLAQATAILPRDEGRAAVELHLWDPQKMRRPFEYGEPLLLYTHETGVGPDQIELRVEGFGHKIELDGTESPFALLVVRQRDVEEGISIERGSSDRDTEWGMTQWRDLEIRMLEGSGGPPYSTAEPSLLLVTKNERQD